MDEMYVKEDLVYNKHSGELVGFANLGETNSQLLQFQKDKEGDKDGSTPALAKTMFLIMVRGFFVRLNFPYVQFPCTTAMSGDLLFDLVWEAIYHLERIQLKVLAITADGASTNRLFLKIHNPNATPDEITYKVYNPHAPDGRFLYFFSDAPHLIKTVRNAWESKKRPLWCNGKDISWGHLEKLYENDKGADRQAPGLAVVPKLKYEHLHLTSFSKMRVDLAAQVLSECC
jgi:hypothetical protein